MMMNEHTKVMDCGLCSIAVLTGYSVFVSMGRFPFFYQLSRVPQGPLIFY